MLRLISAMMMITVCVLGSTPAATPTEQALKLVPKSATVHIVVQDLQSHLERLKASPFALWFAKSEFGKEVLNSPALTKMAEVDRQLARQFGWKTGELLRDVLGNGGVLAYLPNGTEDANVFVTIAPKPELLVALVTKINSAQKESGELKTLKDKQHRDKPYFERVLENDHHEFLYLGSGGVFAFSVSEPGIHAVIDQQLSTDAANPAVQAFQSLTAAVPTTTPSNPAVLVMFDSKALQADLSAKLKLTTDTGEAAFLKQIAKMLSATKAVGLGLHLIEDAELTLKLVIDPAHWPGELQSLIQVGKESSSVWQSIPADALLAVGGRFDTARFGNVLVSFLSEDGQRSMSKLKVELLAPVLGKSTVNSLTSGTDWGLWLTAPPVKSQSALPELTAAIRVGNRTGKDNGTADAILSGLDFAAQLLRVEHNKAHEEPCTLAESKSEAGNYKTLKNLSGLPQGIEPTFGMVGDCIVLASSPQAYLRYRPAVATVKVEAAPLLRISARAVADYLRTRQADLGEQLARLTGDSEMTLGQSLREFTSVIELFDHIEWHHAADGQSLTIALKLKMAKPLRK